MSVNLNIPYSAQYNTTIREGHEHPPPTFGAPTVVWHLAISPHWTEERPDFREPLEKIHAWLAGNYEKTRTTFFAEMNQLLTTMQTATGRPRGKPQLFDAESIPAAWQQKRGGIGDPFFVTLPGSVHFALLWPDDKGNPGAELAPDAMLVKVHAAAHRDFVTLSFYLDVSEPWNASAQATGGPVLGTRRERILSAVKRVQTICEARMVADPHGFRAIDREVLPEHGVSAPEDTDLRAASRFLYTGLWDEFCTSMGLDTFTGGKTGRVFANFRGLVMATDGLPESTEQRKFPGSSGAQPFPRFKGNGGIDPTGTRSSDEPNEANAVVKAFWPFVRRSIRDADHREFVACGVMSWRALYVTALNCPPTFDWRGEAHSSRPPEVIDGVTEGEPIHYLLITKGAPHWRQVGRIVERINSMGIMRLIALRDYGVIRDASTQIQLRGQELDTIMKKWNTESTRLRDAYRVLKLRAKKKKEKDDLQDQEDDKLQDLANEVEKDLIYLSASLDEVGVKAVHGLHFRINRSRYYVSEFESLLASLKVGNIDTWVSYDQFVTRGLKPAFDFIDGVGTRIVGLRSRLQIVLEGIETSALVIQTSRTRSNTAELRKIARRFTINNLIATALGLVLTVLTAVLGLGFRQQIGETLKELIKSLFAG